jgi:hypothetical protein
MNSEQRYFRKTNPQATKSNPTNTGLAQFSRYVPMLGVKTLMSYVLLRFDRQFGSADAVYRNARRFGQKFDGSTTLRMLPESLNPCMSSPSPSPTHLTNANPPFSLPAIRPTLANSSVSQPLTGTSSFPIPSIKLSPSHNCIHTPTSKVRYPIKDKSSGSTKAGEAMPNPLLPRVPARGRR